MVCENQKAGDGNRSQMSILEEASGAAAGTYIAVCDNNFFANPDWYTL